MAQSGSGSPNTPYPAAQGPQIRFDIIGEAWKLFQQQMGVWIMAGLIVFAAIAVIYGVMVVGLLVTAGASREGPSIISILLMFIMYPIIFLVMTFLVSGMYQMGIKQVRGETISLHDMFSVASIYPKLLGAFFLVSLASGVASMCFVIPGLIVAGLLMLTIPLIIDQNMGVMDAMRRSWDTLKPQWLMAACLYFVLSLVAELGSIACGIGVLFTLPLLFLGIALTYRDFFLNTQAPPSAYGTYPIAPGTPTDVYTPQPPTYPPANPPYPPTNPPYPPTNPPQG